MAAEKVRENRLRRMATRQGLALVKTRRRDPRAYDFGTYSLVLVSINAVWNGAEGLDLDQVEERLMR
jgi:hypothetical protein